MINNYERTTFQLEPVPISCASYLFLPVPPWVPWKLAATYPCRTEMLTGLMVQCKAGLSGNSGIGVQSVNRFAHFSAACSSNGTGACVQQWQVLDPHSRERHRFLFSLFMNSLATKQCISWAVREERPGVKKKKQS